MGAFIGVGDGSIPLANVSEELGGQVALVLQTPNPESGHAFPILPGFLGSERITGMNPHFGCALAADSRAGLAGLAAGVFQCPRDGNFENALAKNTAAFIGKSERSWNGINISGLGGRPGGEVFHLGKIEIGGGCKCH